MRAKEEANHIVWRELSGEGAKVGRTVARKGDQGEREGDSGHVGREREGRSRATAGEGGEKGLATGWEGFSG